MITRQPSIWQRSTWVLCVAGALSACSNNDEDTSALVQIKVQAGQEDLDNALIRRATLTETGELDESTPGALNYSAFATNDEGLASVLIDRTEILYFDVFGRDDGTSVTQRRCQVVEGCSGTAFGRDYAQTQGPAWRTLGVGLSENERIRVTALTDLAVAIANEWVYSESDAAWQETGYVSPFSVVQAHSQVSRLFGIDDIATREPADLSQLSEWRSGTSDELSVRYGAILAAMQSLELQYSATPELPYLTSALAQDVVTNAAQLMQRGGTQTTSLYDVFGLAADNLAAVSVSNSQSVALRDRVVAQLRADQAALVDGELTTQAPAALSALLGSDLDDYQQGIARAKAFVNELRDVGTSFFEDGYRNELDQYADVLKTIGDDNAEAFDALLSGVTELADFYRQCALNAGCPSADPNWAWYQSHTFNNGVLALNGGAMRVSQAVADVNTLDDETAPSASTGIDILMSGALVVDNLRLELDHTYDDDDVIVSPTGVRVFYDEEVSELQDEVATPARGYQVRWSAFVLYNTADVGSDLENELTGSANLTYVGVDDPQGVGERRFNLAELVINSRISDAVDDEVSSDAFVSTLFVSAQANQAEDFYPSREFSSLNAFFDAPADATYTEGYVASDLVTYQTGSEVINGRTVQYLDYFVEGGDDFRYRFYPTVMRDDVADSDGDGDTDEKIATHDYEACLVTGEPGNVTVSRCEPKRRLIAEQDLQFALNELWELGIFSRPEVPGQGVYFVEFPVNAADEFGCLSLQTVGSGSLDGTLYRAAQLGLSSARVTSEVILNYDPSTTEPKTLLDVQVSAPYRSQAQVSLALSHDYSGVDTSGVYRGTGSNLDRLLFDYSTVNDTIDSASIAVFKDGVSLSLADGSSETVDSELLAGGDVRQSNAPFTYRVNERGLLDLCVTANIAEGGAIAPIESAVFALNYRDVVVGRVQKEGAAWIIRYIDGSWETLN